MTLAVLISALLLLMLLSWNSEGEPDKKDEFVSVVSLPAAEPSKEAPEPSSRERPQVEERIVPPQPAADEPQASQPVEPQPLPAAEPKAAPPIPAPSEQPSPPAKPGIAIRPSSGAVYGPPNSGSASPSDSKRVGTAPNGEPLYAATWYREPSDDELRGYLSTADGPGWGLIACRTAPDYRVEDCVGLDEFPNGSQINRAVLAAAWQFKVRPPRLGGRLLVGSWVRIRIDYSNRRR